MSCELCGKEQMLMRTRIEGTILQVCKECSVYGEVLQQKAQPASKAPPRKSELLIIVPDYAQRIKLAREQQGLRQDELASHLLEKVTTLQKIETGATAPSIALARKIERYFRIQLVVPYEEEHIETKQSKDALTIGDVLRMKRA